MFRSKERITLFLSIIFIFIFSMGSAKGNPTTGPNFEYNSLCLISFFLVICPLIEVVILNLLLSVSERSKTRGILSGAWYGVNVITVIITNLVVLVVIINTSGAMQIVWTIAVESIPLAMEFFILKGLLASLRKQDLLVKDYDNFQIIGMVFLMNIATFIAGLLVVY